MAQAVTERAEYHKKWYKANKDKVRQNRLKRASDIREYQKTWFADNPTYQKDRYDADPEKHIAYVKKWQNNNPKKTMLSSARSRARKKGIEFNLSVDDFEIPSHCPVFGFELVKNDGHVSYNSACLDRIDVTQGYIKGNVIVVSDKANRIKSDATIAEIEAVLEFYKARR
jgi:hypothetical protein